LEAIEVYIKTPVEIAKERLVKNREIKARFDVKDEDFNSTVAEMESSNDAIVYTYPESVGDWINNNFW
jgi:hypothetical protein